MTLRNKARNLFQISKGRAKETAGRVSADEELEHEGVRDQQVGNLKQAGEKLRDAFRRR
jgi:uncharacterized protein YjbJ (UPF0337 family)